METRPDAHMPPAGRAQAHRQRPSVVVLVSGRGSNLRSLVQARADGRLDCEFAGVVSNRPDAAGLGWAGEQGIATRCVDHRSFAARPAFDEALAGAVQGLAPAGARPWVVLAGFMRILGDPFLERHAGRIVNIHPSLLPLYPGLHTHRQALADGAHVHGATVHQVTPPLDHGPVLAQAIVPVHAGDTEDSLAARVLAMEHRLYPLALQWLLAGRITVADGRALLDGADSPGERVLLHPSLASAATQAAAA
jgi:phosphoribosylglycinamide formyltransferase-1